VCALDQRLSKSSKQISEAMTLRRLAPGHGTRVAITADHRSLEIKIPKNVPLLLEGNIAALTIVQVRYRLAIPTMPD
jgi:hypothetical protein